MSKEAYMTRQACIVVLVGLLVVGGSIVVAQSGTRGDLLSGGFGNSGDRGKLTCSVRTLRGSYGIQMQGTRPVPPAAGGGTEAVIGAAIRTYDGVGNFTQVDNIKGVVTGLVPDRESFGTYHVNEDCSAWTQFQSGPITIEERIVIVDDGNEVRSITASPQAVMVTTVQQRIDRR
jgi:hypothetical protein